MFILIAVVGKVLTIAAGTPLVAFKKAFNVLTASKSDIPKLYLEAEQMAGKVAIEKGWFEYLGHLIERLGYGIRAQLGLYGIDKNGAIKHLSELSSEFKEKGGLLSALSKGYPKFGEAMKAATTAIPELGGKAILGFRGLGAMGLGALGALGVGIFSIGLIISSYRAINAKSKTEWAGPVKTTTWDKLTTLAGLAGTAGAAALFIPGASIASFVLIPAAAIMAATGFVMDKIYSGTTFYHMPDQLPYPLNDVARSVFNVDRHIPRMQ
ncbi:MAG: hypothetical protein HYY52_05670 [Candidatus Melainabacteria bacterium]|nr:hypothetical protein [Candidatus Melainabacteria bacterium]